LRSVDCPSPLHQQPFNSAPSRPSSPFQSLDLLEPFPPPFLDLLFLFFQIAVEVHVLSVERLPVRVVGTSDVSFSLIPGLRYVKVIVLVEFPTPVFQFRVVFPVVSFTPATFCRLVPPFFQASFLGRAPAADACCFGVSVSVVGVDAASL